ncbi:ABC transporter substrate-binding protein [Actinomadura sp. DC4]|uniref:ABC transporter substrate-binding protein n=1 Tax=Actinomadura sp. DC4 TaxID=3055069 RepID=UPI0025AEE5AD|nr:ABC transporter substrate-binding protein [Actinomadura sp. DC4]MDN3356792.1 ABC transporter substrate-binding protein [Actinomadura sp. DC4]
MFGTTHPRRLWAGLSLASALLATGACGSSKADDSGSAPASESGAFPVTLQHSLGTTKLKSAPKRVVALSSVDVDAALALGVVPVLAAKDPFSPDGVYPWLKGRLDPKRTQLIAAVPTIPLERVASVKPDVILDTGDFTAAQNYKALSRVAPTIGPLKSAGADSWQDRQRLVGKALGLSSKADQAVSTAQAAIEATKSKHPGLKGRTFSVTYALTRSQILTLSSDQDFAVQFLRSLGLEQAPRLTKLVKNANGVGSLSMERLDVLKADLMVAAYQTPDVQKQIETNPVMRSATKGSTYELADLPTITLFRNPSTLGIPWLLQRLDGAFAKVGG